MKKLLKYDFYYLKKTSKFIVFPIVIILIAIISPLSAKYLNELLEFTLQGTGIAINFPTPTVYDSYIQYFGNLYEIYLYVIIFIAVGMFIGDKTKGLLPMILSKPINRTKYILSKYISISILIFISLIFGYIVFDYYTYFLFDEIYMIGMLYGSLLYFVYILFILSLALFAATHFKTYLMGIVITFGGYLLFSILGIFEVSVFKYLPAAILNNIVKVLFEDSEVREILLNVSCTFAITLIFISLSILRFRKQDI